MEVVFEIDYSKYHYPYDSDSKRAHIMGNFQSAGGGFFISNTGQLGGEYWIELETDSEYAAHRYKYVYSSETIDESPKKYYAAMTYDGRNLCLYINGGQAVDTRNLVSDSNPAINIKQPADTIFSIGVNPDGPFGDNQGFFKGKVYAARVYNRALSKDDINHNYKIDKERFGLDE